MAIQLDGPADLTYTPHQADSPACGDDDYGIGFSANGLTIYSFRKRAPDEGSVFQRVKKGDM